MLYVAIFDSGNGSVTGANYCISANYLSCYYDHKINGWLSKPSSYCWLYSSQLRHSYLVCSCS